MIFKNCVDQDWIGFNFIGSGLDWDWKFSQSAHFWRWDRIQITWVDSGKILRPRSFGSQIYCIEECTCDIVEIFWRPRNHSAPPQYFSAPRMIRHLGNCAPCRDERTVKFFSPSPILIHKVESDPVLIRKFLKIIGPIQSWSAHAKPCMLFCLMRQNRHSFLTVPKFNLAMFILPSEAKVLLELFCH